MPVLETRRLALSRLSSDDCEFIVELLNEPTFIRHIGDKGVRTTDDAMVYLREGPLDNYKRHGYGIYRVCPKDGGAPTGMCGLVKREEFDAPDLGFAFLERFRGNGFAFEASEAVVDYAFSALRLKRIIAMANAENGPSRNLLGKLGFRYERMVRMQGDEFDVRQYAIDNPASDS